MRGDIQSILIIKPSSLGDIVDGLAVVGPLKKRYPGARIDWLVGERYRDLLIDLPGIDNLLVFDRDSWKRVGTWPRAIGNFLRLVRAAREGRYDIALDLQGLFRSAFIALLSGAGKRVGFSNAREFCSFLYNMRVCVPEETVHAVDRYLLVAKKLGADTAPVSFPLKMRPWALRGAGAVIGGGKAARPVVVINPTARWQTKRWPSERYAAVGDYVGDVLKGTAVLIGGEEEKGMVSLAAGMMKGDVIDLAGKLSLRDLTALLAEADALVTNDTGPMHIAAAVGTPVVAIFGPTDPARTGPYGAGHRVIKADLPCSPCLSRLCKKDELECMESISIGQVAAALDSILKVQNEE
ncbi:MAG: lipopolysaccharide heptosyltransferase II [Candidatus Tritonobacter lacicola]|nr:lipopolysaccharide heptosyltransferase II [Candidatus Tritonobacter lacicola]